MGNSRLSVDSGPRPWEAQAEEAAAAADSGRRTRHDAFTLARKRAFLDLLVKTACIRDACRMLGVSPRTVYNHRTSDPRFDRFCGLALKMSGPELELSAWERGVEGVEEPIYAYGKLVGTRIRRSDAVLRMLIEANLPEKYSRRIRFSKVLTERERERIRQEVYAEFQTPRMTTAELKEDIDRRLDAVKERMQEKQIEQGWTRTKAGLMVPPDWSVTDDGHAVPPGWVRVEEASDQGGERGKVFDSAGKSCNS